MYLLLVGSEPSVTAALQFDHNNSSLLLHMNDTQTSKHSWVSAVICS